jgi:hypothetical protein
MARNVSNHQGHSFLWQINLFFNPKFFFHHFSVAQDVMKSTHSLKSTVYQVQGQVSGRTILPMPVGVEKCVATARELQENAECSVDLYLKSAIEGVVIKWVTQINGEIYGK